VRGSAILAMGKFIDDPKSGQGLNNDHGSGNVTIPRDAQRDESRQTVRKRAQTKEGKAL